MNTSLLQEITRRFQLQRRQSVCRVYRSTVCALHTRATAVRSVTNDVSNLLDLVVGRVGSNCISDVAVQPSHVSDHDIVTWSLSTRVKPARQIFSYKFRSLKNVDWLGFQADIAQSELHTDPANTVDEFADQLDTVITEILDRHCPLQERKRFVSTRRDNRWLSADAVDAKRQRRRLERLWKSTAKADNYIAYRKSCRVANKAIVASRGRFYNERIEAAAADPRRRWTAIRNVLHLTENRQVRSTDDSRQLCNGFAQFFVEKNSPNKGRHQVTSQQHGRRSTTVRSST